MLYLHGMGHYHPENRIDNQLLTELDIETHDQWIVDRVGIHERRTVLSLDYIRQTYNADPRQARENSVEGVAETSLKATTMALERANLNIDDIGMVISGSCAPEYSLPANACVIAAALGIDVPAIDLNSACSGFAAHMNFLNMMQTEAMPDYILCVLPENWTTTLDFRDRSTCVLVGDATVATIISKKHKSQRHIPYVTYGGAPSSWDKVVTKTGGHFFQAGKAVQKFAIKTTIKLIRNVREHCDLAAGEHYFIGHQANLSMLRSVCSYTDIAEEQHLFNVDHYGNCGGASAPSVYSQNWDKFTADDHVILAAVGGGLSWGAMLINHGEQ